jgi:DNA invertase Pin-like site-specific DNA recombinase
MLNGTDQTAKPYDIYARVSRIARKNNKKKNEPSTGGQVAICRLRLADLDLPEGKVLVDPGRSAWDPAVKRPAWDELMDRLERGVSGGFIVFDLERFTRQPKDGERMIELAVRGLGVLDSESEYDLTTPNGKKAFRDAINAAAYYSDRLSTRARRGKRLKAMSGEPNTTTRPFGFEDDFVTVREAEAEIVRELTRRILAGESQNALVRDLNARGILTSHDNPWAETSLQRLLLRERNCGRILYTDTEKNVKSIAGRLPGEPIVSEEDFDRVCAMYAARRRSEPRSDTYLCTGIAFCGRPGCGKPLTGHPAPALKPYEDGSVRRDYRCGPSANGRGCGKISVDQRGLDEAAGAIAVAILSDSRHAEAVESVTRELESEAARLDLAIAEAERVAEALADRLGRGELTLSRYDIANRPLDERIAKLKAERKALGDTAPGASRQPSREHWQKRWDDAHTAEKRELLKMALRGQRLVVDPASLKRAERSDVTRRLRIVSAEGEDLPDTTMTIADVIAARAAHGGLVSTPSAPDTRWLRRRIFTEEYKNRILDEYENAGPGERSALLRREGLHYTNISSWRRKRGG